MTNRPHMTHDAPERVEHDAHGTRDRKRTHAAKRATLARKQQRAAKRYARGQS